MHIDSSNFHDLIDRTQQHIEDILDASDSDIDFENSGGVLTLTFTNGSQIILSRQEALGQLWVATRQGGFHLNHLGGGWVCDSNGQSLTQLLTDACQQQGDETVDFSALQA